MSKFKPGDLVLIVGDNDDPENIGKTGEIVQPVFRDRDFIDIKGDVCTADFDGWQVAGDGIVSSTRYWFGGLIVRTEKESGDSCFIERHLMPLRGDFEPETETREVEVVA